MKKRALQKMLIIGATSGIVHAFCRRRAMKDTACYLLARNEEKLQRVREDLEARGMEILGSRVLDCANEKEMTQALPEVWDASGGFDSCLLGYGVLGDQQEAAQNHEVARHLIMTNYVSVLAWLAPLVERFEAQGKGTLAVISSVAGERGRSANYVYGSAKGALSLYLQGLRQRLQGSGVQVITVLPGFTDTPMTAEMEKGPLFSSADTVAAGIERAMERGTPIAYTPFFWWFIMAIIKHIPERLFVRTSI